MGTVVGLERMILYLSRNWNFKRVKSKNSLAASLQMLSTWFMLIRFTQLYLLPGPWPFVQWKAGATIVMASSINSLPHPTRGLVTIAAASKRVLAPLASKPKATRSQRLCIFQTQVEHCWLDMRCSFPNSCLEGLFDKTRKGRQTFNDRREPTVFVCQVAASSVIYRLLFACFLPWLTFLFSLSLTILGLHTGLIINMYVLSHTACPRKSRLRHLVLKVNSRNEQKRRENPKLDLKLTTNG